MLSKVLIFIGALLLWCIALIAVYAFIEIIANAFRRVRNNMSITIDPSSHCCGIYQMRGVHYTNPFEYSPKEIQKLIDKTKWDGKTCKIILFSDNDYGRGDDWMAHLISHGYKVDKFNLVKNPKTQNDLFLYHWYVTPKNTEEKAMKLSMIREYSYEQEQQRQNSEQNKPGIVKRAGIVRDAFGRFMRRRVG